LVLRVFAGVQVFEHLAQAGKHGFLLKFGDVLPAHSDSLDLGAVLRQDQPETAPELRGIVYDTYTNLYEQTSNGNRAPLLIANHFNNWNGNSFNEPAMRFMTEYCGKPDTYCATYSDVIAWMELQDPAVLQELLDRPPVGAGA